MPAAPQSSDAVEGAPDDDEAAATSGVSSAPAFADTPLADPKLLAARLDPGTRLMHALRTHRKRLDGRAADAWRDVHVSPGVVRAGVHDDDGQEEPSAAIVVVGSARVRLGEATSALAVALLETRASSRDPAVEFDVRAGATQRDATWARAVEYLLAEVLTSSSGGGALLRGGGDGAPWTSEEQDDDQEAPQQSTPTQGGSGVFSDTRGAAPRWWWRVRVRVTCLSDGGALVDACALAAVAALDDSTLPRGRLDADAATVRVDATTLASASSSENGGLLGGPIAVPLTCAVVDAADAREPRVVLADPGPLEERVATLVTVFVGRHVDETPESSPRPGVVVLKVRQAPGGACATTPAILRTCAALAARRATVVAPAVAPRRSRHDDVSMRPRRS